LDQTVSSDRLMLQLIIPNKTKSFSPATVAQYAVDALCYACHCQSKAN